MSTRKATIYKCIERVAKKKKHKAKQNKQLGHLRTKPRIAKTIGLL
jgi:hypothetical protein